VLYRKTKHVIPVQWVNFDYMRRKRDASFNRIIEACDFHGITNLLQFCYNWNQEVITEFYSTLLFDKKERIFMWMTNGRRFSIKLTQFAEILGLSSHLDNPKKIHTGRVMHTREMTPMYDPDSDFRAPKIKGILPHFVVLHRMRRRTLASRIGNSDTIPTYERNIVSVFYTGKNRVVKIAYSSFEMVLQTTKHTMIYSNSGPSLEVIALRPAI
jgi:hypothetical protein